MIKCEKCGNGVYDEPQFSEVIAVHWTTTLKHYGIAYFGSKNLASKFVEKLGSTELASAYQTIIKIQTA